ncbi:MAG: hypothetical protein JWM90_997 [Thermoleophilia bacterium]|nr:hypothetical protein [Thermoleophilia bacterium]
MRSVSWPVQGDQPTFRRRLSLFAILGTAAIAAALATALVLNPALVRPLVPLAASAALLLVLWTHGSARTAARRTEVRNSFAGLVAVHLGEAYEVDENPLLGEYTSRRHAARAAIDRGGWALVVHAWDRYYLLSCRPNAASAATRAPVSFRSRAIADVVPAIHDEIPLSA